MNEELRRQLPPNGPGCSQQTRAQKNKRCRLGNRTRSRVKGNVLRGEPGIAACCGEIGSFHRSCIFPCPRQQIAGRSEGKLPFEVVEIPRMSHLETAASILRAEESIAAIGVASACADTAEDG